MGVVVAGVEEAEGGSTGVGNEFCNELGGDSEMGGSGFGYGIRVCSG